MWLYPKNLYWLSSITTLMTCTCSPSDMSSTFTGHRTWRKHAYALPSLILLPMMVPAKIFFEVVRRTKKTTQVFTTREIKPEVSQSLLLLNLQIWYSCAVWSWSCKSCWWRFMTQKPCIRNINHMLVKAWVTANLDKERLRYCIWTVNIHDPLICCKYLCDKKTLILIYPSLCQVSSFWDHSERNAFLRQVPWSGFFSHNWLVAPRKGKQTFNV